MNQPIASYVLALESTSRNSDLESTLNVLGIAHRRLTAVDGRALAPAELARAANRNAGRLLYGEELSSTQVGCALSHRLAYREFLTTESPWALVLEDDASPLAALAQLGRWIQDWAPPTPTVVECFNAGRVNPSSEIRELHIGISLQRLRTYPAFSVGYFINRAAAQRALEDVGQIAARSDWPQWAADVNFWRTVPNVVLHGPPNVVHESTMAVVTSREQRYARAARWMSLATGLTYLRLRKNYPGGVKQYYRHAVKPGALYWLGRTLGGSHV